MRAWDAARVAAGAGATLLREPSRAVDGRGPTGVSIDSRRPVAGELFVGLPGERTDGGEHAVHAIESGAWGVLVAPRHAEAALQAAGELAGGGAVLEHPDTLAGLQALARAWRAELRARGAKVLGITGSTGKTSTKDILAALLAKQMRVAASPENRNTEIGLPLAILAAPGDCQALVLEMAMRGSGQIAQLTAIAEPDVGVIVNVGPAHLQLLGSIEAIAAAKAELIAGLPHGATVVVPAGEPLLAPHLRAELNTVTFGDGGEVSLLEQRGDGSVVIGDRGDEIVLRPSFTQAHNLRNLLAAVAAAGALGCTPEGDLEVSFSAMRGQRLALAGGVTLIDDCYNANPMSMRAAIDDLCATAPGRRVAVLGDMLELGADAPRLHREIGEHARASGVELLVSVGALAADISGAFALEDDTAGPPEPPGGDEAAEPPGRAVEAYAVADARAAAELLPNLLRDGDTVLVKGSRGVGLELLVAVLGASAEQAGDDPAGDPVVLAPSAGRGRR